jgi:hypothetical protein
MSSPLRVQTAEVLPISRQTHVSRNEARGIALRIVRNKEYQRTLEQAAINRDLPPAVETMLWHYAYGKPADRIEIGTAGSFQMADLELLSNEELAQRAEVLGSCIRALAEGRTDDALALASSVIDEIQALQEATASSEDPDSLSLTPSDGTTSAEPTGQETSSPQAVEEIPAAQ